MQQNVLEHLAQLDLTESERRIADLILADPDAFVRLSAKQVASACLVSVPTLYRLCGKLGVEGLAGLKVAVTAAIPDFERIDASFDFDFPFQQAQSPRGIVDALRADYEQTLLAVSGQIDYAQLMGTVGLIRQSKAIDIYTTSANLFFAQNFAFQMQEIGYPVSVPTDEYFQGLTAANADETHVALLISFGGRGSMARRIPRICAQRGTPLVLLGSREFADGFEGARYRLYLNSAENHYNKMSSFSTRLSILFLLDLIYACYFETDYEHFRARKVETYGTMTGGRF